MHAPEKRSQSVSLASTLLRKLRRKPSENSEEQEATRLPRWGQRIWEIIVLVGILVSLLTIGRAVLVLANWYLAVPTAFIDGARIIGKHLGPFFYSLVLASVKYLWLPFVLYAGIATWTRFELHRRYWCLVAFSVFFLIFVHRLEHLSWQDYRILPLLLLQSYLFLLWVLPREVWNIIGLIVSSVLGVIIIFLPDLPTALDDFGLFGAVLAFFLGYVNMLASLAQRLVKRI